MENTNYVGFWMLLVGEHSGPMQAGAQGRIFKSWAWVKASKSYLKLGMGNMM